MKRKPLPELTAMIALAMTAGAAAPCALARGASDEELAKEISNPIAHLIMAPLQFNWDQEIGPDRDGRKAYLNIQPVVPIGINQDFGVISRTVAPIVDQHVPLLGDGSQAAVGDITQSLFLAKANPRKGEVILGAGPVILIPTYAAFISAGKWGLGPTAVVLKQQGPWTVGMLANHIWSVGGSGTRDISTTLLQPFLAYTTKGAWTISCNTESTYDWQQSQWTVPVNASVAKLIRLGMLPVSIGAGARYYFDSPETGPHGWGARLAVTFIFPAR